MTHQEPKILISEEKIQARVAELAGQISEDYEDCDEVVLIGVLKGSFIFLADLSRKLTVPRVIEFIAVSSYGSGSRSSGAVRLVMDVRGNIEALAPGGGFVFNTVHNILNDVPPENIMAMWEALQEFGMY